MSKIQTRDSSSERSHEFPRRVNHIEQLKHENIWHWTRLWAPSCLPTEVTDDSDMGWCVILHESLRQVPRRDIDSRHEAPIISISDGVSLMLVADWCELVISNASFERKQRYRIRETVLEQKLNTDLKGRRQSLKQLLCLFSQNTNYGNLAHRLHITPGERVSNTRWLECQFGSRTCLDACDETKIIYLTHNWPSLVRHFASLCTYELIWFTMPGT
jgi:hypothetical protein